MYARLGDFGRLFWSLTVFGVWLAMMWGNWLIASSMFLYIETQIFPQLSARTLSPIVGDFALLLLVVISCILVPIVLTIGLVRVNRKLKGQVDNDDD